MHDTSIAIEMKVNSERYWKRDSNSILYLIELYFDLLRFDQNKQVKVLTESFLVEKTILTTDFFQYF